MKKNVQILQLLITISAIILQASVAMAQKETLPEIKMPEIEYKPSTKNGWVGQYVYELHFFDSLYYKNGKYEKRLWLRADNTYTGFIEFPREIRGAIRSNQTDKNNIERYESWIQSGTSNTWSLINDTIKRTEPIGVMGEITVIGKAEKTMTFSSQGEWIKGWLSNADLQIDHTEKKYSLAVPMVTFEIEGSEWGEEIYFNPVKKVPISRKDKGTKNYISMLPLKAAVWDMVEDTFQNGQKEIMIRKRIPLTLGMDVAKGTSSSLLTKKEYMDFYLVLKRVPLAGDDKNNKSVSTKTTPVAEQEPEKAHEQNSAPEKNTKKKRGLGALRNKVNGILGENL